MRGSFVYALVAIFCICSAFASTIITKSSRQDGEQDLDWWKKVVYYQIYPRSFMDSDGNGVGDIKGIIEKLDHLRDAGIGATWLSPVLKSPMVDFGYDIQDFKTVDPLFGSNDDLSQLVTKAHELNIKVIMDFVPNHSSNLSQWFIDSENEVEGYEDFYVWQNASGPDPNNTDKFLPPNNWRSVFSGPAWTWSEKRKQFYLHQFTPAQPDLNFRNDAVVAAMTDVLEFWLDFGIDGFRIDAINHMFETDDFTLNEPPAIDPDGEDDDGEKYKFLDHIYTRDLNETYDLVRVWREIMDNFTSQGGDAKVMMTEAYTDFDHTMQWYGTSEEPISHVPFNFALIMDIGPNSTAAEFKTDIDKRLNSKPSWAVANWVLGNHDRSRVATRYRPEQVDALNILLMTLPGIAVTYNGEEIGMVDNRNITWDETQDPQACQTDDENKYQEYTRDPVRTPFQWDNTSFAGFSTTDNKTWLPVHPDYETLNLAVQVEDPRSHYNIYKQLTALRQENVFLNGNFESKAIGNVFAYRRWLNDVVYGVAINLEEEPATINMNDFNGMPVNPLAVIKIMSGDSAKTISQELDATKLNLDSYEAIVFQLKASAVTFTAPIFLILAAALLRSFF